MADMDNILDLFDIENNDDSDIVKNEHYYISEVLKLIKETNDFPLFIYSMLKTLLQKKHLLNDAQIKEISEILNIKPVVKEVVKYTDFLAKEFSKFFPDGRYNYTKLGTMKDKIVGGDLDFTTLVTTEVSKGKALNWWRLSIAKAITQLPKLEKLDGMADTLNEKQLKNLRWNQYCITIVEAGLAGEDILPMMNLTPAD